MSQPLGQDASTLAHNLLCEAGQGVCNNVVASANAYLYRGADGESRPDFHQEVGPLFLFDLLIPSVVVFTAVHVFFYMCHQIVWFIPVWPLVNAFCALFRNA